MRFATAFLAVALASSAQAQDLELSLRYQEETQPNSGRFHRLERNENWKPEQTAIIVCDMWDLHHCLNAVRRAEQMAPRMESVLKTARDAGVTIIHAPSSCMAFYQNHPSRTRAKSTPRAAKIPSDINKWCSQIPAEEKVKYPIDQSDGGEDDDPQEHAEWASKLKSMGRNPRSPWKRQTKLLSIDEKRDYISDNGSEIWSILAHHGIENVILTGVHTNMCVLGRPFGLRQMAKNGKNVVLLRDLTDTMYNPQRAPFVSHFTGTDLIVSHIERHVCPTISSGQILRDENEYRFPKDKRPHIAFVIAEDEYKTEQTLPVFALKQLGKAFRVSFVFANDKERNDVPGLRYLDPADLIIVSVRRRVLPPRQMKYIKAHIESGKPVVGLRTASHAFSLRNKPVPEGLKDWPNFDPQVFGGNYQGHHGNNLKTTVRAPQQSHPVLKGIPQSDFASGGSLYKTSPLKEGATTLLYAEVEGHPKEPVAWVFVRKDGGRSFYTSLGHVDDFECEPFVRLLVNGIHWALDRPVPDKLAQHRASSQ